MPKPKRHAEDDWIELTRIDRDHRPVREAMRASAIVAVRTLDSTRTAGAAVHGTLVVFDSGGSALVAESRDRVLSLLKHEPAVLPPADDDELGA